jgi:Type 2A encapsulin shell protein SrpI-like
MATTTPQSHQALGDVAARQLANAQKTAPTMLSITPRWLVHLLPWVGVEAGIYRLNKVKDESRVLTACSQREDERELPETFVDYEEAPREFYFSSVTTVVDVHTRVSDLYSHPYDQIKEQLRLAIETIRERQEDELLHNSDYGILTNVAAGQKIKTLGGPPTPDDLDELITLVWKEPAFFLAHPKAIAASGREATRRGVPPASVSLFGSPVITWRGIPLIPSSKLEVKGNKTQILLMRTGESRQGVVGLFQPSPSGEHGLGLSVKFMGISRKAIASYLISLYCSAAILTDDAVAVLEGVEVDKYHQYDYAYRQ